MRIYFVHEVSQSNPLFQNFPVLPAPKIDMELRRYFLYVEKRVPSVPYFIDFENDPLGNLGGSRSRKMVRSM